MERFMIVARILVVVPILNPTCPVVSVMVRGVAFFVHSVIVR
jgi:hypothetical protein